MLCNEVCPMRNVLTTENQEKLFAVELTASGLGKLKPAFACRECLFFQYNFLKTLRLDAEIAIHFYCDDNNFQRVWNDPGRLVKQVENKGILAILRGQCFAFGDVHRRILRLFLSAGNRRRLRGTAEGQRPGKSCRFFKKTEKELRTQRPNLNIVTFGLNGDIQDSFYQQFKNRTRGK
jgi:hypothetical protein